jgi:hypothetical protein
MRFNLLGFMILVSTPLMAAWYQEQVQPVYYQLDIGLENLKIAVANNERYKDVWDFYDPEEKTGRGKTLIASAILRQVGPYIPFTLAITESPSLKYKIDVQGTIDSPSRLVDDGLLTFKDLGVTITVIYPDPSRSDVKLKEPPNLPDYKNVAGDMNDFLNYLANLTRLTIQGANHRELMPPNISIIIDGSRHSTRFSPGLMGPLRLVAQSGSIRLVEHGIPLTTLEPPLQWSIVATPIFGPKPTVNIQTPNQGRLYFQFIDSPSREEAEKRLLKLETFIRR